MGKYAQHECATHKSHTKGGFIEDSKGTLDSLTSRLHISHTG